MRALIFLTTGLLIPIAAFSLSCPNNGRILNTGYSIQEVSNICGQAISTNSYANTTIISAEWLCYKTNIANNTNTKLSILFDHNAISNISIQLSGHNEENVKSSNLCGMNIHIGNNMQYVKSVCGNPIKETPLQSMSSQINELRYDDGNPNILVFENDILIDWKYS